MNTKAFKQTLDYIKTNSDKWNQRHGITRNSPTHCFIAITALLNGLWDGVAIIDSQSYDLVREKVKRFLDISGLESSWLYYADKTIDDNVGWMNTKIVIRMMVMMNIGIRYLLWLNIG